MKEYNFIETEKKIKLFLNSFSLLEMTVMYFSRLSFSRTSETKSSNCCFMAFKAFYMLEIFTQDNEMVDS